MSASSWTVRGRVVALHRPLVMGIINVTPDSFSDGGRYLSPADAMARAARLLEEGADILDVGGESTRPHEAQSVTVEEELRRVVPVVRAISARFPDALISVDTVKSEVAAEAIAEGAHIVNDVSATRLDPSMRGLCARQNVGLVLMHSRGTVEDMGSYVHATYVGDPVEEVLGELRARIDDALAAGMKRECVVIDPGIGFAKRSEHSLRILSCLGQFAQWGFPLMVGVSRKRFVGELTGVVQADQRVHGSLGAAVAAYERGARIFRVHDVAATRRALDVAAAIRSAGSR